MSEEEQKDEAEVEATDDSVATATEPEATEAEGDSVVEDQAADANLPDFPELDLKATSGAAKFELRRFAGVQVVLTAELGRTQVTIQELMSLTDGSVLELDRAISAPVELVAQGVPLGNGEVVVIDDRFAIRIKEIY